MGMAIVNVVVFFVLLIFGYHIGWKSGASDMINSIFDEETREELNKALKKLNQEEMTDAND